jgi:hypothetical protein
LSAGIIFAILGDIGHRQHFYYHLPELEGLQAAFTGMNLVLPLLQTDFLLLATDSYGKHVPEFWYRLPGELHACMA